MRKHRRDRGASLSPVLVGYGKAIEVQVNQLLLRRAIRHAPSPTRHAPCATFLSPRSGSRSATTPAYSPTRPRLRSFNSAELSHLLGGKLALGDYFRSALADGPWFTNTFAATIDECALVRNSAAHGEAVHRASVVLWRNRLLAVGCDCVIGRLALVGVR